MGQAKERTGEGKVFAVGKKATGEVQGIVWFIANVFLISAAESAGELRWWPAMDSARPDTPRMRRLKADAPDHARTCSGDSSRAFFRRDDILNASRANSLKGVDLISCRSGERTS